MTLRKAHIIPFTIILGLYSGFGQNLVLNPSFEEFINCPSRLGNFEEDVAQWNTPTAGSTDYFNGCSSSMGTPKNFNGEQPSDFGEGYAGLYLYAPDDYREYIQVELKERLEKGRNYQISFYVSLAERSDYAVKEFGILFSKKMVKTPIRKELSKMQLYKDKENTYNFMEVGYTNFFRDTKDWVLVNTQFTAKGVEKFMTIGNFNNNARTRKFKTKRDAKQGAYYYIDMIALKDAEESTSSSSGDTADLKPEIFELDKTHTFRNVLFEFDKFQLLETAKEDLKKIYNYIKSDSTLHITINGHTDNIGSMAYNQELSDNRCRTVAEYMVALGLGKERISWLGYGSSKPIADNTTDDGRKTNRRVEFIIKKVSQ